METKFQTSFIPKKPLVSTPGTVSVGGGTSVLMILGIVIFIASVGAAVGTFLYSKSLDKQKSNYQVELTKLENRFGIDEIEKFKRIDLKIGLAKKLLSKHIASPEIFSIISQLTTENIRFTDFNFSAPDKSSGNITISMNGVAKDYYAVAFQSQVFGASREYGKNKLLINPVVSDVSEGENGTIRFSFSAEVEPKQIYYETLLKSVGSDSSEQNQNTPSEDNQQ